MMSDSRFLGKSYKSAFVMAAILMTAVYAVLWAFEIVVRGRVDSFDSTVQAAAAMCGALILVTLFVALPATILIYRLDARHFGPQAVLRWLVMGFLLGLGLSVLLVILPRRQPGDSALVATLRWLARAALSWGAVYLSHWLAFKASFGHARGESGQEELAESETERQE